MPKGARIDAYLESLKTTDGDVDDNGANTPPDDDLSGGAVSDDSLDATASHETTRIDDAISNRHHNEFLQQLKMRLKKTAATQPESTTPTNDAPSDSMIIKPEAKPRKVDSVSQTEDTETGWKQKRKAAVAAAAAAAARTTTTITPRASIEAPVIDDVLSVSGEEELKATIKQLRHVDYKSTNAAASTTTDPMLESSSSLARVRQLVTQKVEPLQHHRPLLTAADNNKTNGSIESADTIDQKRQNRLLPPPPSSQFGTADGASTSNPPAPPPPIPRSFCTLQRSLRTKSVLGLKSAAECRQSAAVNEQQLARVSESIDETPTSLLNRAQSLRDLTNRFEKLQMPPLPPPPIAAARASCVVADKRHSMMEGSSSAEKPPRALVRPVGAANSMLMMVRSESGKDEMMIADSATPPSSSVNKDSLVDLYRRLDGCVCELRGGASDSNPNAALIRLSDFVQQFQTMLAVYAQDISPHSKFRYRYVDYCNCGLQPILGLIIRSGCNFYVVIIDNFSTFLDFLSVYLEAAIDYPSCVDVFSC